MGEIVDGSTGVQGSSRHAARGHEGVQAEAIEALTAALAQEGGCKRVDTHMSHLFLGKVRVYKLVRAVDHVYADLASVESCRSACRAEMEANRALAPGMYVAARPIVRRVDGTVRLGGRGEVIDWIVEMRRFPAGALFSELADGGALTLQLVEEMAETVARFYGGLPPRGDPAEAADYPSMIDRLEKTVSGSVVGSEMASSCKPLFQARTRTLRGLPTSSRIGGEPDRSDAGTATSTFPPSASTKGVPRRSTHSRSILEWPRPTCCSTWRSSRWIFAPVDCRSSRTPR